MSSAPFLKPDASPPMKGKFATPLSQASTAPNTPLTGFALPEVSPEAYDRLSPGSSGTSIKVMWCKSGAMAVVFVVCLASAFWAGRLSAVEQSTAPTTPHLAKETKLWEPQMLPSYASEPLAKSAVRKFDQYLMLQAAFDTPEVKTKNVEQWLAPDFVYETVAFGESRTPKGWCQDGEESQFRKTFNMSAFSQMLFFGTDKMATTTSYGNVFWAAGFRGIPAAKKWTYFRVTDFYWARKTSPSTAQIYYNFMMIDFADLLRRVGYPVVPPAALPEGLVMTAHTNDGVPAPLSVVAATRDSKAAKAVAEKAIQEDWVGQGLEPKSWSPDLIFWGPGGIGHAQGREQYQKFVLEPFRAAFADRAANIDIFDCEGNYCGAFGHITGRHVGTWLGLEPTQKSVAIRFAMHWRIVDGLVEEGWLIWDLPGLFQQVGVDFWGRALQSGKKSDTVHI